LLLLLAAAGCASPDHFDQRGTWKLPPAGLGANDANLRAMLVNPNDLVVGASDDTSLGALSARPVELLVTGRRRPLPSVSASEVGASAIQPQQQGVQGGGTGTQGGPGGTGTQQ
jgi:hypothetical protein